MQGKFLRTCAAFAAVALVWAPVVSADEIWPDDVATFVEETYTSPAVMPLPPAPPGMILANCGCNVLRQDCANPGDSCFFADPACDRVKVGAPSGFAANGACVAKNILHANGLDGAVAGAGFDGWDRHSIEPPNSLFGNNTAVALYHQADDFIVPPGETWTLSDGLTWLYMTNATQQQKLTAVFIQIWEGTPGEGGVVVAGDMTTNRLLSVGVDQFAGTYRTTELDPLNVLRIFKTVSYDLSFVPALDEGTYWIEFGSTGEVNSGPWLPVRRPGDPNTDNSRFFTVGGAWAKNIDAQSQLPNDRPFILYGEVEGGADTCSYEVANNVKAKDGCQACPNRGDRYDFGIDCAQNPCKKKATVKNVPCPDGNPGSCKKIKGAKNTGECG